MTGAANAVQVPTSKAFLKALPWIVLIFVFSFLSWKVWTPILTLFMPLPSAQFASCGVGCFGAYVLCVIALAGNWPVNGIKNGWARGIAIILLSKAVAAALFILLGGCFGIDLTVWAFPIIGNAWLVLAATSFVGGDAHLQHLPPVRRAVLNLLISAGLTIVLMRTMVQFPTYWFTFLQCLMSTGGAAYYFRRVKQPTFSLLTWSALMALMFAMFFVAQYVGHYTMSNMTTQFWTWNVGSGSMEFNLFFAITCGLNFAVFAMTQCWPFCRLGQPWGTPVALVAMLIWSLLLTILLIPVFQALVPGDGALWEAQIMVWHTVFWGFAWVYAFGIGQTLYLWAGQKTPGTWDDVD